MSVSRDGMHTHNAEVSGESCCRAALAKLMVNIQAQFEQDTMHEHYTTTLKQYHPTTMPYQ